MSITVPTAVAIPFWGHFQLTEIIWDVDAYLLAAQCYVESEWNYRYNAPYGEPRGIAGFPRERWERISGLHNSERLDPYKAISVLGEWHYRQGKTLEKVFGLTDPRWRLAAWELGFNHLYSLLRSGTTWRELPKETRNYVDRVLSLSVRLKRGKIPELPVDWRHLVDAIELEE